MNTRYRFKRVRKMVVKTVKDTEGNFSSQFHLGHLAWVMVPGVFKIFDE